LAVAAAVGGLALLLSRFGYLGLAPFDEDGAILLLAAWKQIETGQLADHSPLAGGGLLHYGPTPLWFFAFVQGLIGRHALGVIAANVAIACACQLAFIFVLHVRGSPPLRPSYWALAGVLLVAASSPYEFFWSRRAADLITNLGPFVALAILALDDFGTFKAALLGLVLGLCISAHPMAAPFALACLGAIVISRLGPFAHRALSLLAASAMVVIANLTWLNHLRQTGQLVLPVQQSAGWQVTLEQLLETYRAHSIWGVSYFVAADWETFSAAHPWLTRSEVQQASLALAAFVTLVGLLALALQWREPGLRRIAFVGIVCAAGYPFLLSHFQLDAHPEHQFPVVWLTVAGAAGVFYVRSRWLVPVRALALVLAAANVAFIVAWGDLIRKQTGTRDAEYGTPVAEQTRFVRAACEVPGRTLHIDDMTAVSPAALQHHYKSEPKCRGKKLDLCDADSCQAVLPPEAVVRLSYRDPEGGALAWAVEPSR
jgi:hypothetical protein